MSKLLEKNQINYIFIGNENTDVASFSPNKTISSYRLEINAAIINSIEEYFKRMETSNGRILYRKKCDLTFIISTKSEVQWQVLEAILDKLIDSFFSIYGKDSCMLIDETNKWLFNGFSSSIIELIKEAEMNDIKWIMAFCKICQKSHRVAIKKSTIERADNFPVSFVFLHKGHGLLLYIDKNFRVRGVEQVHISG